MLVYWTAFFGEILSFFVLPKLKRADVQRRRGRWVAHQCNGARPICMCLKIDRLIDDILSLDDDPRNNSISESLYINLDNWVWLNLYFVAY